MNHFELVGKETRDYLESINFPRGDIYSLVDSEKKYLDGENYGIEIASAQTPDVMQTMLKITKKNSFTPNRFTETRGIFRLTDDDIKKMVNICLNENIGLILSIGPRAFYDTSASARSEQGARISYRLRGMENIVRAVEDVKRAISLGVRGILVYDEGLLSLLNRMKQDGLLPRRLALKVSVHCGHGNPLSLHLLEQLGATSVNVVGDLELPMIASCRKAINIPIDIHTDTPKSSGGFIRTYDVPDLIRVGSPIFLKCGAISSPTHAHLPSEADIHNRIYQAYLVYLMIQRYCPEARAVSQEDICVALPEK
ncbi:MAG: peptidase [Candidatus Aminicenantes bacterium]|jgi:hypothetical protein